MEQNRAKFSFNFEKKTINKTVISFMEKSVLTEDQNNWVSQMAQGKKLKKGDANMFLQCLFAAIIPEGQEDEEDDPDAIFQDSQEVISQDAADYQISQSQNSQNQNSQSQNSQSQKSQSQNSKASGSERAPNWENKNRQTTANQMCKFYKKGKCRYGKECRNEHPKFCKKFIKHGSLKFSPQGCDGKCEKPHPDACRDSLRTKECNREKCRFYHIKGTNANKAGAQGNKTKESYRDKVAKLAREEEKPEQETKQGVFLEMEKSMIQKMEQMLNQQMESFINMVRPQSHWMGLSQRSNPMTWNNS